MSTNFNFFKLFILCFKSSNLLLLIPLVRAIVVNDVYKKLYEKYVDNLKISNKIILLIYGLLVLNFLSFRKRNELQTMLHNFQKVKKKQKLKTSFKGRKHLRKSPRTHLKP